MTDSAHSIIQPITRRGLMLVLSSPSGAGKTTISRRLIEREVNLSLSVSMTTRPQRPGEVDQRDYAFVKEAAFKESIAQNAFLEYAHVFGHYYGTPKAAVEETLSAGKDVLFDIDWQGTQQLSQVARGDLVSLFILPPTWKALESRLRSRAQDAEDIIQNRMSKAESEMSHWAEYDYVLVNQDLDATVDAAQGILKAERLKRRRQPGLVEFVKKLTQA